MLGGMTQHALPATSLELPLQNQNVLLQHK